MLNAAAFTKADCPQLFVAHVSEPLISPFEHIAIYGIVQWFMDFLCFVGFADKYDYVGRLLKPGEEATNYSDEEEEGSQQESAEKSKHE
jgi:hypothetical protein